MALIDHVENSKKISIIGLAKNTGKTVALQQLLNELREKGIVCGITSIGYDGERFDQINNLIEKPRVFLQKGSLVATTEKLFNLAELDYEILKVTQYNTPLGLVAIGRVIKEGYIEIAGPSTSSGVSRISDLMLILGAEKIIIDGAINRKAISSPHFSDGVIIATGAVLNQNEGMMLQESIDTIKSFSLGTCDTINDQIRRTADTVFIDEQGGQVSELEGPLLMKNEIIDEIIRKSNISTIITEKTIVESFLDYLLKCMKKNNQTKIKLVINDHSKLFLVNKTRDYYTDKGVDIQVRNTTNILAVTVNPTAPLSHKFDSISIVKKLRNSIKEIPIYDVLGQDYK